MLKMIDVSDAQGDVDWTRARHDRVRVAGVKASEGADFVSRTFTEARVSAMRKAAVALLPYHYLRFRRDRSGATEADHCLAVLHDRGWKAGRDLPVCVDVEWIGNEATLRSMSGGQAREYVAEFTGRVRAKTKRGCITYLSPGFAVELGNRAPRHAGVSWVAAWDAPDGRPPTPAGFDRAHVLFHQTSDAGHVPYVESGVCDLDVFLGDSKALSALIDGRPVKTPRPAPASSPNVLSTRETQKLLRRIGWPLKVDGVRGPRTVGAIMDFQRGFAGPDGRLIRDGVVGRRTAHAILWSVGHSGACSAHFKFREFASSHPPHWIKTHRALVVGLERLRAHLGHPIGVLSGYRDFALGATRSQHRYGNAMDPLIPLPHWREVAKLGVFSGIGHRPDGLVRHVDARHIGPNFTGGTLTNPTVFLDTF